VHKSTIYRELKRNQHPKHEAYLPDTAQRLSLGRRHHPGSKLKRSKQLQQIVEEGIAMLLSPEVIAGRLEREKFKHRISHESIYKWIYFEAKALKLHEKLCRRKRYRGLRPSKKSDKILIPERTSIHERPDPPPGQMGHWEADTVHFAKGIGAIVTLYDKTTKILFGAKMKTRKSQETIDNIKLIFEHLPKKLRRTMTFDNGSEFTNHLELREQFGLKTYFCDTYASWQKGGVENVNGILRRFIPRGSKVDDYSPERVQQIIHQINSTPRKSLGYLSAYEFLLKRLTNKVTIIPLFNQSVALRV
jgi:IS30 family transposase